MREQAGSRRLDFIGRSGNDDCSARSSTGAILRDIEPRPLTEREAETLAFLLAAEFPGAEKLRVQARTAEVVDQCDCGCATVHLAVDPSLPVASEIPRRNAVDAAKRQVDEDEPPTELILFVKDGRLSSIEIVWYGDAPVAEFPPPEEFDAPVALWATEG